MIRSAKRFRSDWKSALRSGWKKVPHDGSRRRDAMRFDARPGYHRVRGRIAREAIRARDSAAKESRGAWDAQLSLHRPYQLELHEPAVKRICGTIGFVVNHYASSGSRAGDDSKHVGVYDLDLSLLGLNW